MFDVAPPRDRQQLGDELERLHGEIAQALAELPLDVFLAPQGGFWSPAGHLRHLNKSVRPVARAMGLSKWALIPIGGLSLRGSRSFEEVRQIYLLALEQGAQAGRFGPSARQDPADPSAWRQQIFEHWRLNGEALQQNLAKWGDRALDRFRLPHPVLGRLTVREMLYFTLYHNAHHARRVFERLESSAS